MSTSTGLSSRPERSVTEGPAVQLRPAQVSEPQRTARLSPKHRAFRARLRSSHSHQMVQRLTGAIGWPAFQENARWNSGRFRTTPLARNSSGEWGSVCMRRADFPDGFSGTSSVQRLRRTLLKLILHTPRFPSSPDRRRSSATVKIGEESQLQSTKIGNVFAQGKFPVHMQIVDTDEAVVFFTTQSARPVNCLPSAGVHQS